MKKYLLLLGSLIVTGSYADTTQVVQDDVIKESTEALKCPPAVTAVAAVETAVIPAAVSDAPIKPKLDVATEAPAMTIEDFEAPVKDLTPTEKLKVYRQKLEERNLVLLGKKMEMIRLQQEMALLRNLERAMNQTLSAIDKI